MFASKDFSLDPFNKTNHLHLIIKYGMDSFKEYVLKSNNLVQGQVSSSIQLLYNGPLFIDKSEGQTYLFENPEFFGLNRVLTKIQNSSSESVLSKELDNFLDSEDGRIFLEKTVGNTLDISTRTEGAKVIINISAFKTIHQRVVVDFCQKSDYLMFIDTRMNKPVYKHRDSFEAKYPNPYLKQGPLDKNPMDIFNL